MKCMTIFGKNSNVNECIKSMNKKFNGETILSVSQRLSEDTATRSLFEMAFNVRIYV